MENQNTNKLSRILIISAFALLLISLGLLILIFRQKPKVEPVAVKTAVSPTSAPTVKNQGELTLVKVDNNTFDIYADLPEKDIVGYDILIGFDKQKGELISAVSADPNFNIFRIQKNNLLIITGTKKLTVKEPTVFSKTKILTIRGASVSIISQSAKETTKFVDSASKIYYPKIAY